jgi:hypothetical protein
MEPLHEAGCLSVIVCRFQYLSLGHYIAHGSCPHAPGQDTAVGKDDAPIKNILSEASFATWKEFFQNTSAALTVRTDAYRTSEVCFCSRTAKKPMQVTEQRTFTYQDAQVWPPSGWSGTLWHLQCGTGAGTILSALT